MDHPITTIHTSIWRAYDAMLQAQKDYQEHYNQAVGACAESFLQGETFTIPPVDDLAVQDKVSFLRAVVAALVREKRDMMGGYLSAIREDAQKELNALLVEESDLEAQHKKAMAGNDKDAAVKLLQRIQTGEIDELQTRIRATREKLRGAQPLLELRGFPESIKAQARGNVLVMADPCLLAEVVGERKVTVNVIIRINGECYLD